MLERSMPSTKKLNLKPDTINQLYLIFRHGIMEMWENKST